MDINISQLYYSSSYLTYSRQGGHSITVHEADKSNKQLPCTSNYCESA